MNPVITMLYPSNVMPAWPHVAPLLAKAVSICGTHDVEDVRRMILSGQAQLWIQWNDRCDAALVTEFVNYPKGLWLRIWLAGAAKDASPDWQKLFDEITEFAYSNQCVGLENLGRDGWEKLAQKHCPEAQKEGVILRFPLRTKKEQT